MDEQKLRDLTEKLYRRGLAMTMGGARELAISMLKTEERVQAQFNKRVPAEDPVTAARRTATGSGSIGALDEEFRRKARDENANGLRERAANPQPVRVQTYYDTPANDEYVPLDGNMTVAEAAALDPALDASDESLEELAEEEAPAEDALVAPASEDPQELSAEEEAGEVADEAFTTDYTDVREAEPVEEAPELADADEEAALPTTEDPDDAEAEVAVPASEQPAEPLRTDASSDTAPHEVPEPSESSPGSEPAPESPSAPSDEPAEDREDLGKKHGVDIGNIFDVNK